MHTLPRGGFLLEVMEYRHSHSVAQGMIFRCFANVKNEELLQLDIDMPICVIIYSKSSPELVLQWTIEATEQGGIVPHMRLLPRMHKKCESKCDLDMMPQEEIIMRHQ